MDKIEELIENLQPQKKKKWPKILFISLGSVLCLIILLSLVFFTYNTIYKNKIYPGVYVGDYHLGGMPLEDVVSFAETLNNKLSKEGIELQVLEGNNTTLVKIQNVIVNGDNAVELIVIDSAKLAESSLSFFRDGNSWQNFYQPLFGKIFSPKHISAPIILENNELKEVLKSKLGEFEIDARQANITSLNLNDFSYEIISEKSGRLFDYEEITTNLKNNISSFNFDVLKFEAQEFSPTVLSSNLKDKQEQLKNIFSFGNLSLNFIDPNNNFRRDWVLKVSDLSDWIEAKKSDEDEIVFGLNQEKVLEYFKDFVEPKVDKQVQNAKFEIEGEKVKEFQGSNAGIKLNTDKTFEDLNLAFLSRNYNPDSVIKAVSVSYDVVEPKSKVSDVNDLGIEDVIGVGVSTFRDSHNNRIKNIAHAVDLLNGVLIKPDEEFSTTNYAGPFTTENGYLPEAVIKGNEIKDEVGGGMCQIGTTLFRTAMNSAMPITERRNHSLVVSYYADPVNGNPGTDATIYEPILDFKFLNDTGHYLLLQTDIDYTRQQLTFTLWGKKDGRKGWYDHPVVDRWIPVGEPQITETTDLAPGVEKCQSAFVGAVAHFTYSRLTPEGEQIDRLFESYYRPLSKICVVGVAPEEIVEDCEFGECEEVEGDVSTSTEDI